MGGCEVLYGTNWRMSRERGVVRSGLGLGGETAVTMVDGDPRLALGTDS